MKAEETIKNWSVHVEFLVIFVTLLGGYYMIDAKFQEQSKRSDHLYETAIQTLREIKELHGRTCILEERTKNR